MINEGNSVSFKELKIVVIGLHPKAARSLTRTIILGLITFLSAQPCVAQEVIYPAVGNWNGYLGQVNVVECVNGGSDAVLLKLTVLSSASEELAQVSRTVPGHGTVHIILNEYSIADAYGTYRVETPGTLFPKLSCLTAFYRLPQGISGKAIEYAYVLPVRDGLTGPVVGLFNSMNPTQGPSPVLNFLSLVNLGQTDFSAQVEVYNSQGNLLPAQGFAVRALKPGERRDFPLGHHVGQVVGMYRVVPNTNSTKYQAFTTRYSQEHSGSFNFAFPLQAQKGSCAPHPIYASTFGPAYNWAELLNPSDRPLTLGVSLKDQNGLELLPQTTITLSAYAQRHLPLHQYLGPDNIGSLHIRCINAEPGQTVLAQSLLYGLRPDSGVNWAYAHQLNLTPITQGQSLLSHLNTHLGADNWSLVLNTGQSTASVKTNAYQRNGSALGTLNASIPAMGLRSIPLHPTTGADNYGLGATDLTTDASDVVSELLRVYRNPNGQIEYIANVPAVSTSAIYYIEPSLEPNVARLDFGLDNWSQTFLLTNAGAGINYTVTTDSPWLSVNITSGFLEKANVLIQARANPVELVTGEHFASITIEGSSNLSADIQVVLDKPVTSPLIIPWLELNTSDSSAIDNAVTGLLLWRRVTDTAVVSTTRGREWLFTTLRQRVPGMRFIPGIKTVNTLGLASFDNVEGWGQIAASVAQMAANADSHLVLFENETALQSYWWQGATIDFEQLTYALSQLPTDLQYIWFPTVHSRFAWLQQKSAALCEVVDSAIDVRMVDQSIAHPYWINDSAWIQNRQTLENLSSNPIVPKIYLGCYGETCFWTYEGIPYAMQVLAASERTEVLFYPGSTRWVEAAEQTNLQIWLPAVSDSQD